MFYHIKYSYFTYANLASSYELEFLDRPLFGSALSVILQLPPKFSTAKSLDAVAP